MLINSYQVSQYANADYLTFLKEQNLMPLMSRCLKCHDNALVESLFATSQKRVIIRKIYSTREEAKNEMINFYRDFFQSIKRHIHRSRV